MKTTGREWKAFYCDDGYWGDYEIDHIEATLNGVESKLVDIDEIAEAHKIVVKAGYVWNSDKGQGKDLLAFFREWKKRQATATLIVECDKAAYDAVVEAIKAAGGKVVK